MNRKDEIVLILEFVWLCLCSILLKNGLIETIIIMTAFILMRWKLGGMHYDNRLKCFIMTSLVMISIFVILQLSFMMALFFSILAGYVLSEASIDET